MDVSKMITGENAAHYDVETGTGGPQTITEQPTGGSVENPTLQQPTTESQNLLDRKFSFKELKKAWKDKDKKGITDQMKLAGLSIIGRDTLRTVRKIRQRNRIPRPSAKVK